MNKIRRFNESNNMDKLKEDFNFLNLKEAMDFIRKSCDVFDDMDHHPDLFCLKGKSIRIELITHSEGEVTEKDFEVLERLEELVSDCCKPLNPHLFKGL